MASVGVIGMAFKAAYLRGWYNISMYDRNFISKKVLLSEYVVQFAGVVLL